MYESDYIELPEELKRKTRLLTNVKNCDCKSILYCMAASLMEKLPQNKIRASNYNIGKFVHQNVRFPTPVDDIPLLESFNNMRICVYELTETNEFKIKYKSQKQKYDSYTDVLLLQDDNITHYVYISNISSLLKIKSEISCPECNCLFKSRRDYKNHMCIDSSCCVDLNAKRRGLYRIACKSDDLLWQITGALYPQYRQDRFCTDMKSYAKFFRQLAFPDISNLDVCKAVRAICSKLKININVFIFENKEFCPYIIPQTSFSRFCDLLMIDRKYFMIIRSLSSIYCQPQSHRTPFICRRCLEVCMSSWQLQLHQELCSQFKCQKSKVSTKKKLKFTNYHKIMELPFIVYADFESIISPIANDNLRISEHIPVSCAYRVTSEFESQATKVYVGLDCVKWFINELLMLYDRIRPILFANKPLNMSLEDELSFQETNTCHICGNTITGLKCRDHSHITGDTFFSFLAVYFFSRKQTFPFSYPNFFRNISWSRLLVSTFFHAGLCTRVL